jgi:hypothetical protein
MDLAAVFTGVTAFCLLALLGVLTLSLTRSHQSGLRTQWGLFLGAFTLRFLLSAALYGFDLGTVVVGDGDDTGWYGGVRILEDWERQGLGPLQIPYTLLDAFKGHHRGYGYVLAVFFYITRLQSQLAAAALDGCCGALSAVLACRIARSFTSERVALRVGWWTSLFPVMVIWSAQTIKEPVIILLEMAALYGCVRLRTSRFAVRYVLLCSLSVVALASMRFYAACITGLTVLFCLALPHLGRRSMALGGAIAVVIVALPLLSSVGNMSRQADEYSKWDLNRVTQFRQGMVKTADSGVDTGQDLQTSRGLGLAMLAGGLHLLLAPFPWQMRAGSLRMALTAPEMIVWWFFFFRRVLPGLGYAVRHRLGDALPLLVFLGLMGGVYSLTFGNVGTAYRQRAQLMPYFLVFAGLSLQRRMLARAPVAGSAEGSTGEDPDDPEGPGWEPVTPTAWSTGDLRVKSVELVGPFMLDGQYSPRPRPGAHHGPLPAFDSSQMHSRNNSSSDCRDLQAPDTSQRPPEPGGAIAPRRTIA